MANAAFIPLPDNIKQIQISEQSYSQLTYAIIIGYGVLSYWYSLSFSVSFQQYHNYQTL